ncbi:MAG: polysaccharide deacetylase family protein [Bdellovibrionales bacterium]|nr:polysaccharide deacetylase family protein [Bdellovibrionales bacterium]
MKLSLLVISVLTFSTVFASSPDKQFPNEGQIYIPGKDTGFSQYLTKSLKGTQKIVLTFDDGPDVINTPKLLDTLKKFNVKATFFILTERINEESLPIIKRIISDGHNLASHHLNHSNNNTKTEAVFRSELKKSINSVATLLSNENSLHKEVYYRFPYGNYGSSKLAYHHLNIMKDVSKELFNDNCINFAFWDIDTVDWLESMTAEEIAQNVMSNIFGGQAYDFEQKANGTYIKKSYKITKPIGGGVVLMHDVHARSVSAVPKLLQKFKDSNVEVVPLQEVEEFSYHGKECRLL